MVCLCVLLFFFKYCSRALPLWEACLTRSLSLSSSYTGASTCSESCQPQQKPPKLNLTRSCPLRQPATHTIGIIDQSSSLMETKEENEQRSHFFSSLSSSFSLVFSANVLRRLWIFLSATVTASSLFLADILCNAWTAKVFDSVCCDGKGNGANMQAIYHL